jgi:fructose-specific phosphotransferase system IIC component
VILGLIAGFTGIVAGFSRVNRKSTSNNLKSYIVVSIIGCAVTSYLGIEYILPTGSSLKTGLPYIIVVLCYLVGVIYALRTSSE